MSTSSRFAMLSSPVNTTFALASAAAALLPSLALAQSPAEQRDLEQIKQSYDQQTKKESRAQLWQNVQRKKLQSSFVNGTVPASGVVASQKCYPWAWEGGERDRVAMALGAELCLSATLDPDLPMNEMKSEITALGTAESFIFNKQFQVAEASAHATAPMVGDPSAEAAVTVLGQQVWADSATAPNLVWTKQYQLPPIDKSVTQTFMVGPIPGSVTVGFRGTLTVDVAARLSVGNAQASTDPHLVAQGYAFGGIEAPIAKGGVEANLLLADESLNLNGTIGLAIDPTQTPLRLLYAAEALGTNRVSALRGNIDLVAQAKFPIPGLGKNFRYPLYSNPGFSASGTLFHEKIGPTPIEF